MISKLPSGTLFCTLPDGSRHCTGSAMGRRETRALDRQAPIKFYLRRERLNMGGYDSGGAYWGRGMPLYRFESVEEFAVQYRDHPEQIEGYERAYDREDAKRIVRATYPRAVFFGDSRAVPSGEVGPFATSSI